MGGYRTVNDRQKIAPSFPTLEACLIAREPVYLVQAAELRRQFDARVADAADWLQDYQLRLEIQCILRDDDPEYDEDAEADEDDEQGMISRFVEFASFSA